MPEKKIAFYGPKTLTKIFQLVCNFFYNSFFHKKIDYGSEKSKEKIVILSAKIHNLCDYFYLKEGINKICKYHCIQKKNPTEYDNFKINCI